MPRVVVIHRDLAEASMLAARASRDGLEASPYPHFGAKGMRALRESPPDAIIIDLTSLPSYGKYFAALLRENKGTRSIPLIFIQGDPAKMGPIREAFPDIVFTTWARIGPAVKRALERQPAEPIVPKPWSGTLQKKLRIREGSKLVLKHAPDGFTETLGTLPEGARLQTQVKDATVLLVFVKSRAALGRELPMLAKEARQGLTIWLIWPKKSAGASGDLAMPQIHEMCMPFGLTGYKICAVDETWSALAVSQGGSGRARKRANA